MKYSIIIVLDVFRDMHDRSMPAYIQVRKRPTYPREGIVLVDDIRSATKFDDNDALSTFLDYSRKIYGSTYNLKEVIVDSDIFGSCVTDIWNKDNWGDFAETKMVGDYYINYSIDGHYAS